MKAATAQQLLAALLVLTAVMAGSAASMTAKGDKVVLSLLKVAYVSSALEEERDLKHEITSPLFSTWTEGTDPCLDGWAGVTCSASPSNSSIMRVTGLSVVGNRNNYIEGILLPDLAELDMLESIDFSQNQLRGKVPNSYATLENLRFLNISYNQLDDNLPGFLGSNRQLQTVDLSSNSFRGLLPEGWCGADFSVILHHNRGLCGHAPSCPEPATYPTIAGGVANTHLATGSQVLDWICDDTPPVCVEPVCTVDVASFTTRKDQIEYTFRGFYDDESGISGYEVRLVSPSLGGMEVIPWRKFDGEIQKQEALNVTEYYGLAYPENIGLQQGNSYTVHVRAYNDAGPQLSTVKESNPTIISLLLPTSGNVYNSGNCENIRITTITNYIKACFNSFKDDVAGIAGFYAQIVNVELKRKYDSIWVDSSVQGEPVVLVQDLQVNSTYYVQVWAVNNAGITSEAVQSSELRVEEPEIELGSTDMPSTKEALLAAIIAISIVIFVAMGLVLWLLQRRYLTRQWEHQHQVETQTMVKALIKSLQEVAGDEGLSGSTVRFCKELAFVTTDLMDSTKMAAADVEGFTQVQDIHDSVMREAISMFSGYEINTEGDAFLIAFRDIFDAIKFCMHVQYRLLEVPWSRTVLKLPSCKAIYGTDGQVLFKGPRVRMGIHWAQKGTFNQRLHPLTKHRIFAGPGWRIAQEIGDGANGGQVLITHAAWNMVRQNMSKADYPVVQQVGLFKFDQINTPIWVYEIKELLCQPLDRRFGLPRGIELVANGWGLNIMSPPFKKSSAQQRLSVVALVLKPPEDACDMDLPQSVSDCLYEKLAIQVMQFRGYIFRVNKKRGYFLVAFGDTLDSVRFCHAFQLMIMFMTWPPEAEAFSMPQEIGPDGRLVFNGPRIAMAINEQPKFEAITLPNMHPHREDAVDYAGPCVDNAKELSAVVNGGQVVLTQHAWIAVQDHIPGQAQALSLGVHRISSRLKDSIMLMQVMPGILSRRQFPVLATYECSEPGYLSSPDPAKDMAIVFVKVEKPMSVKLNEQKLLHQKADKEQLDSTKVSRNNLRNDSLDTLDSQAMSQIMPQCFTEYLQDEDDDPEADTSAAFASPPITPGVVTSMPSVTENQQLLDDSIPPPMERSSGSGSYASIPMERGSSDPLILLPEAEQARQVLRAYAKSMRIYEAQLRDTLKRFNGYECKEPEPGKFTLAFSCLEDAIMWGTTLQEELIHMDWPEELLSMRECVPAYTSEDPDQGDNSSAGIDLNSIKPNGVQGVPAEPGEISSENQKENQESFDKGKLINRGLRVQMGCAYGRVASRKPLNTGRADYFGNLPNTAARVMSLAKPGQFLIEGSVSLPTGLFVKRGGCMHDIDANGGFAISIETRLHGTPTSRQISDLEISNIYLDKESGNPRRIAQLSHFGYFLLKGLDEPRLMLQAASPGLSKRKFVANKSVEPTLTTASTSRSSTNTFKLFYAKEIAKGVGASAINRLDKSQGGMRATWTTTGMAATKRISGGKSKQSKLVLGGSAGLRHHGGSKQRNRFLGGSGSLQLTTGGSKQTRHSLGGSESQAFSQGHGTVRTALKRNNSQPKVARDYV